MYKWLKYIYNNHPDAILGAKLDDDTFLCVPQIFHRLNKLLSPDLYYGWRHGNGTKIHRKVWVDEMFVVIGRNLIKRVASRRYCGKNVRDYEDDLIDKEYGDTSLAEWLSVYNDIDLKADNDRIVHFGGAAFPKYAKFIRPNFCSYKLIFHKSTRENMKQLQYYNDIYMKSNTSDLNVGSVTGNSFTGQVERVIPPTRPIPDTSIFAVHDNFTNCENWAVVTTVFSPSKAVKYISKFPQWCLVIVADTGTPSKEKYFRNLTEREPSSQIKYLSMEEQIAFYPLISQFISFKNFGRKNIGYIYAIHHKARYIWDFDDDNSGVFEIKDLSDKKSVTVCKGKEFFVVNPYPYFGISESRMWPRGFPLQHIKDNRTITPICRYKGIESLAVIQSLANQQPDVDAIFRLTRDVPTNFFGTKYTHHRFILPRNTYAPFNAQATFWFSSAFTYMALPISVNGRVSDIWRSFIAQHFFHKHNLSLAFSTPYVVQERNIHDIIADFNGELDLYEKGLQIVELLRNSKYNDIQNVYEDLYRRKYLHRHDLDFIHAWTRTLSHILVSN